jgi:hypothetical protein
MVSYQLDGNNLRLGLNKNLGFSETAGPVSLKCMLTAQLLKRSVEILKAYIGKLELERLRILLVLVALTKSLPSQTFISILRLQRLKMKLLQLLKILLLKRLW